MRHRATISSALALLAGYLSAGEVALKPLRVCEVLGDAADHDGKVIALVGRYSFRSDNRYLSEDSCGGKPKTGTIPIHFDSKTAPKPPEHLEIDEAALQRELKVVKEHTSLAVFRFGTPDYDRWAVVYGRVEKEKDSVRLIAAGDGVVMFIVR